MYRIFGSGSWSGHNVGRHRILQPDILLTYFISITALERECYKVWLAPNHFLSANRRSNKHALCTTMCNNNTNQITDISALQFICKLRNFMHIISMQSNGAAIKLSSSGSGQICWWISGHIQFRPKFKKFESGTSLIMSQINRFFKVWRLKVIKTYVIDIM